MHTKITARHCEIPDELRHRAERVLDRLAHHAARPVDATLVFDNGPLHQSAELRLHLASGEVLVAAAEGSDHRSALDRVEEKLRRQLDKAARARRSRRTGSSPQ